MSQHRTASGDAQPHPATESVAQSHAQRCQATSSDRQSFPETEEVTRHGGDDEQFDRTTD
jgi:hypothetical protein